MIVTTTPGIEGMTITEYRGIVFGEVITGINVVKDIGANAIVGVDFDYEVLGAENNMLMVTASGTAVYAR